MLSRLKELVAKKEREAQKAISQGDIAKATGLDPHTVSRWMQPKPFARIEADAAKKLCNFLGCQIGDLLYIDYTDQSPN